MKAATLVSIGSICLVLLAGGCFGRKSEQRDASLLNDKVVTARVESALNSASTNQFNGVVTETTNGIVTLKGFVLSGGKKKEAEALAAKVDCVRAVKNEIVVRPQ